MHFPFSGCPEGSKQVLFCEGATKGSVQNITTLFFMGGGTCQGCHIQEARNYLGLLPYNELFFP